MPPKTNDEYLISNKRYYVMVVVLMIIWFGIMTLVYIKLDEITTDPCSLCAKRMKDNVKCYIQGSFIPLSMEFYPNGSIDKSIYPKLYYNDTH